MSDPAATAQRQQQHQQGFVIEVLTLPFRFIAVLFGSLLLSIVIECVGMYLLWPDEGWRHSQQMYAFELGQLSEDFKHSAMVQEPGRTAQALVLIAYDVVMIRSGLEGSAKATSQRARTAHTDSARNTRYYAGSFYMHLECNLIAAAYTILVFVIRLLVLFLSLPLFVLAAFVGLIDGLVCRDVRRFGAGRESGYLYHRAKACVMPLATLPWIIYLAIPVSVEAVIIVVPSAALFGIAIAITARSFKKYL